MLHAQAAEILRESASPEPEAIAHHFTEAGLDDLAIEWWGKAGDQALRRSAFQEAISHLGRAIAMADKAGGDEGGAAPIGQRLKLQTHYARAIAWSRGYAADETKAAVARVQELVTGKDDIAERLNAYYVPIATNLVNGEVNQALTIALTFLRESIAEGELPDIVAAHRLSGLVYTFMRALCRTLACISRKPSGFTILTGTAPLSAVMPSTRELRRLLTSRTSVGSSANSRGRVS